MRIEPARSAQDVEAVRALLKEYAIGSAIDRVYPGIANEIANLPGVYVPPHGELLLCRHAAGAPLGCIGLRPLEDESRCELKRLYVVPEARRMGLGSKLIEAVVGKAERLGYREILLDTLPSMVAAIRLYEAAGFAPIAPYYETSPETLFFSRRLTS